MLFIYCFCVLLKLSTRRLGRLKISSQEGKAGTNLKPNPGHPQQRKGLHWDKHATDLLDSFDPTISWSDFLSSNFSFE